MIYKYSYISYKHFIYCSCRKFLSLSDSNFNLNLRVPVNFFGFHIVVSERKIFHSYDFKCQSLLKKINREMTLKVKVRSSGLVQFKNKFLE